MKCMLINTSLGKGLSSYQQKCSYDRKYQYRETFRRDSSYDFDDKLELTVNHLKKAGGEIWLKRRERRNNTKTTKMRTKSPQ